MSATIDVNKLERENSDSAAPLSISEVYKQQQLLVEKYESAYRKYYLINFIVRLYWLILFSSLLILGIYSLNHPKVWETIEPFTWFFLTMPILITYFTYFIWPAFYKGFRNEINKLEDKIVKEALKERFTTNQKLKNEIEDFYIELNSLTKAKYETAIKFSTYESLAYIVISLTLAVLLRLL